MAEYQARWLAKVEMCLDFTANDDEDAIAVVQAGWPFEDYEDVFQVREISDLDSVQITQNVMEARTLRIRRVPFDLNRKAV